MSGPSTRLGERACVTTVELDGNTLFFPGLDIYVGTRVACLFDYLDNTDYKKETKDSSKYLSENPSDKVMARAAGGDLEAFVEVAIRYLSGCGMNKSPEGALYQLDVLTNPNHGQGPYFGDTAPRELKAKAHSCAAQAYLNKVFIPPAERASLAADERRFTRRDSLRVGIKEPAARFTNFSNALEHANESAKLGLVSPAVLTAGFLLRDFGDAAGIDLSQMTRSRRFGPLWQTVTRRLDELYAEERIKQMKIAKNPAAYVCAAEGCGIRAEERAALRKCAGRCPPDLKPHYCSPECQKKDWLRHKAVCKPGSKGRIPGISDQPKAIALGLLGIENTSNDGGPSTAESTEYTPQLHALPPGPARTIDIPTPGTSRGYISVTSNTLEAGMMKYIREEMMKPGNEQTPP
ncbi:hypothetical protein VTO73DRAFT_11872 [Trametes versicolor]